MDTINHLLRGLAPIPPRVWQVIEDEARNRLIPLLAARQVVSFVGPGGWEQDALPNGRTKPTTCPEKLTPCDTKAAALRKVQPLAEVRIPFTLTFDDIAKIERGGIDFTLDKLDDAAKLAADFENYSVFNGWKAPVSIEGIVDNVDSSGVELPVDTKEYPAQIAKVVTQLQARGIAGPYTLAIGTLGYQRIIASAGSGCNLLSECLARILGGKIVLMPCLDAKDSKTDTKAVVLSERGGDFLLNVGQDLSIGYTPTTSNTDVSLYLEETFTFRVARKKAALTVTVKGA